jgi:hypothetical protein
MCTLVDTSPCDARREEVREDAAVGADAPRQEAPSMDRALAGDPVSEPAEEEDAVTRLQSVDAFNSLEDGQPGPPGQVEVILAAGADRGAGKELAFEAGPEVQYTPRGPGAFARHMALNGAIEFEADRHGEEHSLNLGWGQRWLANGQGGTWVPTIGGLTEVNLPLSPGFTPGLVGDSLSETLTIAEAVGPGSAYLNGVATGVATSDTTTRRLVLGVRAGYQWNAIDDELTVIADVVREQSEEMNGRDLDTAELSVKWGVNDHLTLGPGVMLGLDRNPDTPRLGGGLVMLLE